MASPDINTEDFQAALDTRIKGTVAYADVNLK